MTLMLLPLDAPLSRMSWGDSQCFPQKLVAASVGVTVKDPSSTVPSGAPLNQVSKVKAEYPRRC
jgi:hypothetical protein